MHALFARNGAHGQPTGQSDNWRSESSQILLDSEGKRERTISSWDQDGGRHDHPGAFCECQTCYLSGQDEYDS